MSNDNVIEGQFTERDREDLDKLESAADVATYNAILKVWLKVLEPAEEGLANDPITPMWANKITSSYREVNFGDMGTVKEKYYAKLIELRDVLQAEIDTDDECFNVTSTEEDLEHNGHHYLNVLRNWQLTILGWEMAWDYADPAAGAEIAAISEVQQMFFGSPQREGLTAYLESIKFEFTDSDREELATALEDFRVAAVLAKTEGR